MITFQIIQSISIILASWSVLYGIGAWRREHRGKRQIELAEETLALFYEASDAIRNIRCSLSFSSETDHVQRNEKENDAQFEARKRACIVFSRYEEYRELFSKIHSMRYRFMAQVGKKKAEPFNELRNVTNSILNSAHALARLWPKESFRSDKDREKHEEHIAEYEAYFWEQHGDENDAVNPKVDQLIQNMETTCRSIIEGQGTLFGVLNKKIKRRAKSGKKE